MYNFEDILQCTVVFSFFEEEQNDDKWQEQTGEIQ